MDRKINSVSLGNDTTIKVLTTEYSEDGYPLESTVTIKRDEPLHADFQEQLKALALFYSEISGQSNQIAISKVIWKYDKSGIELKGISIGYDIVRGFEYIHYEGQERTSSPLLRFTEDDKDERQLKWSKKLQDIISELEAEAIRYAFEHKYAESNQLQMQFDEQTWEYIDPDTGEIHLSPTVKTMNIVL